MIANGSLSTKGLWCTSNLHWLRCKGGKRIGVFIGGYEQKNQHNVITDSTYAALVTVPPPEFSHYSPPIRQKHSIPKWNYKSWFKVYKLIKLTSLITFLYRLRTGTQSFMWICRKRQCNKDLTAL